MPPHDTPAGPSARSRLVQAALRLFAEKGYEAAGTREIAEAAGANISAIRYYFGDKAGLYRAAFTEPMADLPARLNRERYAELPLAAALGQLFRDFLEPLKRGERLFHLGNTLGNNGANARVRSMTSRACCKAAGPCGDCGGARSASK